MFVLEGYNNIIYLCILRDCLQFFFVYIYWCMLLGDFQVLDIFIDCNVKVWYNKMKDNLEDYLKVFKDYILNNIVLKVVILCFEESEDIKFILNFIIEFQLILILEVFVLYLNILEELMVFVYFDVDFKF